MHSTAPQNVSAVAGRMGIERSAESLRKEFEASIHYLLSQPIVSSTNYLSNMAIASHQAGLSHI